jgi:hypothetical protein
MTSDSALNVVDDASSSSHGRFEMNLGCWEFSN